MSHTHRSPNQDTSRRNLTGPLSKARAAKHARLRPRQLRCEPLEDRRLLSVFTYENTTSKAIPDKGTLTSTISVPDSYITADVNVTLNITHTRDEDLDVFLIAPDGTRVELFTDVGGTGDNFTTTVLDDSAATSITTGKAPFTGTFRPEGNLSLVEGKQVQGTWKLEVTDDTKKETGTLKSWSLTVTEATGVVSAAFLDTNPAILGNVATACNDVVVSENGDAMAMWLESKGTGNTGPLMVMAARYDAVAGTWETPAIISDSSSTNSVQQWSRIASDGQGNYLVAWQQQPTPTGYSSIWANRYVAGTGWQTPQVIGTGSTWSYNPEVAMARDQTGTKAVVVWSYENKLYDRRLVDFANGTWSSPEIAGSGGSSYGVVMGPDGDFLTVSVAQDATSNNLFYRNYDWQTGWANNESLMVTSSEVIFVPPGAMKINASGVAMVVWYQYTGDGAAPEVWGRRWNGPGWGSSQRELIVASLSPAEYGSFPDGPALSVSDNGEAAVTWHQRRDGSTFTNAYVRRYDGTAWQLIEKVDSEDLGDVGAGLVSGNSMGPAGIAMDDSGNIMAVWQQSDGVFTNIWGAKFDRSTSIWSPAAKVEQAPWDAIQPVVAMNSSGVTTTIWLQPDNTLYHIYASRDTVAPDAVQPLAEAQSSLILSDDTITSPSVSSTPRRGVVDAMFAVMASDGFARRTDPASLLTLPTKSKARPRSAVDSALLELTAPVAAAATLSGTDAALTSTYDVPVKKLRIDTVQRSESRAVESQTRDLSYTVGAAANRITGNNRLANDKHHTEVDNLFAQWDSDPFELLSFPDLGA